MLAWIDLAAMELRAIGQVKDGATAEVLGLQGGDIVFDADNICYLWHKSDAPEVLYTFPQPIGTGNTTATYLGLGNDIRLTGCYPSALEVWPEGPIHPDRIDSRREVLAVSGVRGAQEIK